MLANMEKTTTSLTFHQFFQIFVLQRKIALKKICEEGKELTHMNEVNHFFIIILASYSLLNL